MSGFKGTPAPWNFSFHGSDNCWVTDNENDKAIAKVTHYGKDAEQQRANFHLIAAAPELLEALQDALHAYDKHGEHSEWDFARAAIAKALGEAK